MRTVDRCGPQANHVHTSPQSLFELAVGECRHMHLWNEIAPCQLGQHTRVQLVGLGRQRPDCLSLAGVSDLHRPAASLKLIADPRSAAHHLQARDGIRTQTPDERRQAVFVRRHPTLIDDRAQPRDCAPSRTACRPVDPNELLHQETPFGRERPEADPSHGRPRLHDIPCGAHTAARGYARRAHRGRPCAAPWRHRARRARPARRPGRARRGLRAALSRRSRSRSSPPTARAGSSRHPW